MTLNDLASLGSFVSGLAVLVSLIYLATQVRQATKHTRAQISQAIVDRRVDIQMHQASAELSEIVMRGRRGDETMTALEVARFMSWARSQFWNAEDIFLQYREGMLRKEMYGSFRSSMVNIMRGAGMQTAWESLRLSFIPDFTAFMDDTGREAIVRGYFDFPVVWRESVAKYQALERAAHPNTTAAAAAVPGPKAAES
jgi:hypothetical protein